ncbi:TIGR02301 family protein [Lichenibacterium dinghuense]|uniref:TIGR02301 family protein n=1 Tax=Lichenibacterium dinghuense TaxID=2895977 RepID=UPI001F268E22|nr:TIGR02301 family protein [Lichenibacterium sp. 6Y81]
MRRAGMAAALFGLAAAAPAAGQGLPANPPLPPVVGVGPPAAQAAPDPDGLPPYEPLLESLAERLGALALMRDLCGEGDAARFRDRMAALLDVEGRSPAARDRLAGAFNRGLRGYAASYRSCTPSARLVESRALAEADRLTRDIESRYGGT